ncbi:3-(3-hydroxy-phenyl)propionate/3-hydroxycinnamic acid hydroxylase-like protein [Cladobotryum mycophilum]|uniref:3-(3-hydroxy-phenyl)propionate/3-hydroxycinnamic acid hydroxylase-like protein n=1 Tax=Cladobotryum mycophilum TaxID=491253 RepID=A0ABR0S8S2_9HYPO
MEETQVVIVGAGPAGLCLGLTLAKLRVKSVILEKETEITTDPRGVYLTGDAVRILHDLGLGPEIAEIGHEVNKCNFHSSSFSTKPFHALNIGTSYTLQQVVPESLLQMQPRLDGKTGIVRKHFLEQSAGIRQEEGLYPYQGTWIAANLKMTLPTPQTHPGFPLWKMGYSTEEVYDLFWPAGWHFCGPPGKPTAAGRFGPHSERTWRHELRQEDWDDSMDAEQLLWEHLMPMITLDRDLNGRRFPRAVQYPRDCINILRCRPFRFTHKVVNKWFHKRTILIGDAAHVFPPFAGQGIGSGMRDAHQLAWRLALLLGSDVPESSRVGILQAWALERRKSVDDAALFSMLNGRMCNDKPPFWLYALLRFQVWVDSIPFLPNFPDPQGYKEREAFTTVEGGAGSILTLLVISSGTEHGRLYEDARAAISATGIGPVLLSEDSIVAYNPRVGSACRVKTSTGDEVEVYSPAPRSEIHGRLVSGYDERAFVNRLGGSTRFAIVRPDLFVFACAKDVGELVQCLALLRERVGDVKGKLDGMM